MQLKNALLIQPVSVARMATAQNPDAVLKSYFGTIASWVKEPTNDVAIIFTTGLYLNVEKPDPRAYRLSLLQRENEWGKRFNRLLRKNADVSINGFPLLPEGFLKLTWDAQITQSWNDFSDALAKLALKFERDQTFRTMIETEITSLGRMPTASNVAFLLEEIAVTSLWLKERHSIPKILRIRDQLDAAYIVYPGPLKKFIYKGLEFLLQNKKSSMPLIWIDTTCPEHVKMSEYRFGRDAPTVG